MPLDEIIRHYYCIQMDERTNERVVRTLVPNYEVMLVLNFGTPMRVAFNSDAFREEDSSRILLLPPLRKTLRYERRGGADAIILVFTLNGFYRLFGLPVDAIAGDGLMDTDGLRPSHGCQGCGRRSKNWLPFPPALAC